MKRIKRRAAAVLAVAALVLAGVGVFLVRLAHSGDDWAMYRANASIYENGLLRSGTVTDRNGLVLARAENGEHRYAESAAVRKASLHAVGDFEGYIGTGALSLFAPELTGYTWWKGTTGEGGVVRLSIDARLQTTAWEALDGRNGAVVVLNYETGEILCMVSAPAYDPAAGADESLEGVYLNRATQGAYTPGSVFKLVTLAAALEEIPDLMARRFTCQQYLPVGADTVTCTGWHGEQTVEQALANSCNCAFGELALELGSETLARYAEKLGISTALTLDGAATSVGRFDEAPEGSVQLAWSGIGQHNDLATPYAVARLCAAIANGGTVKEPTLLKDGSSGESRLLPVETAQTLGDMMNYTVVYSYGRDRFPGLDLCAKSGTAEIGDGSSHAWFAGYLQSGAPLAFAVIIERGGGGLSQAGAAANTILQTASEMYGA